MQASEIRSCHFPGDRKTARAEFFGLILRMLETPDQGRTTEGEGGEALLLSVHALKDNSGRTERLLNQKIQKCGGSSLTARSRNLISTIIQDAERLALRMGAQRAHVMFRRPSHRDLVTLDEYFGHDGGTLPIGTSIQVDLALEPCMVRIGDGRDDLTSIRVISKGSVIGFV